MSYRHYYHHRIYNAIHSDFWRLELAIWLQTLAWSLVAIFVPILMLRYGYSLEAVLVYNAVFYGLDVPLNFLVRRIILAWGARAATVIGILCAAIFVASFHYLSLGRWDILLGLAALQALYDSFYWVGQFYLFIESSGKPEMAGRSIGIMTGVRIFGGMLGPAFGALVIVLGGQNILLFASAAIFILAIIPLFALHHVHDRPTSTMPLREFLRGPRERRDYLSFGLYCIHAAAEDPIWSIFIFMTLGTLNSIAVLAVVVSVSTILLSYFTGVVTKQNAKSLILVGSLCSALVWILRLTVPNPVFYYASVLFIGFFAILVSVPIDSRIVEHGKIKDALWAATLRNASSMLAPFFLFLILLPLVAVFKVSFIAAVLALLALMFVTRSISAATGKNLEITAEEAVKVP
jgi:MFS family permease